MNQHFYLIYNLGRNSSITSYYKYDIIKLQVVILIISIHIDLLDIAFVLHNSSGIYLAKIYIDIRKLAWRADPSKSYTNFWQSDNVSLFSPFAVLPRYFRKIVKRGYVVVPIHVRSNAIYMSREENCDGPPATNAASRRCNYSHPWDGGVKQNCDTRIRACTRFPTIVGARTLCRKCAG